MRMAVYMHHALLERMVDNGVGGPNQSLDDVMTEDNEMIVANPEEGDEANDDENDERLLWVTNYITRDKRDIDGLEKECRRVHWNIVES